MAHIDVRLDGDGALSELVGADTAEEVTAMREAGTLIDLSPDGSIILAALEDGMVSGAPAIIMGFKLPDGKVVLAQTSWRLFASAFHALASKFGTPYPDLKEMELLHPGVGSSMTIVGDDEDRYMICVACGEKRTFEPQSVEGSQPSAPLWWLREHFEAKHPEILAKRGHDPRVGLKRCALADHHWIELEEGNPIGAKRMCDKCAEVVY